MEANDLDQRERQALRASIARSLKLLRGGEEWQGDQTALQSADAKLKAVEDEE